MKRGWKLAGMVLIGILILIQFFRPERNNGNLNSENDLLRLTQVPETIIPLLRSACYDCHSNHTDYPWYSQIAPVSWYMNKHIEEGKEELNFSDFGTMEKGGRIGVLADICDAVDAGSMPLQSYMMLHRKARLSEEEKEAICIWTEEEAMRIMRE